MDNLPAMCDIIETVLYGVSEQKVASKVEKIIGGMPPEQRIQLLETLQEKMKEVLKQSDKSTLKNVCGIIEYIPSCRSVFVPLIPYVIKLCKESVVKNLQQLKNKNQGEMISSITFRLITAMCQKFRSELIVKHEDELLDLSFLSLNVTATCAHIDVASLAATAFCTCLNTKQTPTDVKHIFKQCLKCESDNIVIAVEEKCYEINVINKELFQLCLCSSVLHCCSTVLLTELDDAEACLLYDVFLVLGNHCKMYSRYTFFAFKTLVVLLQKTKECIDNEIFYQTLGNNLNDALEVIIELINTNWESPISGVRNHVSKMFSLILDILENNVVSSNSALSKIYSVPSLVQYVTNELPWRVKMKYLMLLILLPRYGVLRTLKNFSNIPDGMILSLSCNHLLTVGTDLYKLCLNNLKYDDWCQYFFPSIERLLSSNDNFSKQNVFNYWMSPTVKAWPSALQKFLELFDSSINKDPFSHICLLRVARKEGLLSWSDISNLVVGASLHHFSDLFQIQALGTVCLTPKLTVPPDAQEFELLKLFLFHSINSDSAPLRQCTITSFTYFINRLKESCKVELKRRKRSPSLNSEALSISVEFLQWLHRFLIGNFEPGVNYQRKILSLQLYKVILTGLSGLSETKNTIECCDSEKLEEYARMQDRWLFHSEESLAVLLRCIQDPSDDIRRTTSAILCEFFTLSEDHMHLLFIKALHLCNSSLFYQVQSGALLCALIARCSYKQSVVGCLVSNVKKNATSFVDVLVPLVENNFLMLKNDLLEASLKSPMHGLLNALSQVCIECDSPEYSIINEHHTHKIFCLLENIVHHLLDILASKSSNFREFAPSFAEMGEAIQGVIQGSTLGESIDDETLQLSPEHQLVLNCIWLNLKECCSLAANLTNSFSSKSSNNESKLILSKDIIERCGRLIIEVLTKCRHKGAIESAGLSLTVYVRAVYMDDREEVRSLPKVFLNEFLNVLEQSVIGASLSRRSAGLAIFINRLVGSGPNAVQSLLRGCVERLLALAEKKIPGDWELTQTSDLPQTQAIHLLKILTQDASLREEVAPYMSDIVLLCFRSFSSQIWTVRNAALQLFGAVVPKMLGKKKAQYEDVVGGSITVEELFSHYPHLQEFLLDRLSKAEPDKKEDRSTLVPALVLLSQLTVGIKHWLNGSFLETLFAFQNYFVRFLSSDSQTVRRLAAKSFCGFTPYSRIYKAMVGIIGTLIDDKTNFFLNLRRESQYIRQNELHGILLVLKFFVDRLKVDGRYMSDSYNILLKTKALLKKLKFISESDQYSFYIKALCDELVETKPQSVTDIVHYAQNHQPLAMHPGITLWAKVNIQIVFSKYTVGDFVPVLKHCLQSSCSDICEAALVSIQKKLGEKSVADEIIPGVISELLEFCLHSEFSPTLMQQCLNTLLMLCQIFPVSSTLDVGSDKLDSLYNAFVRESRYGSLCSGIAVAVISGLLACKGSKIFEDKQCYQLLTDLICIIKERCSPACIEDLRLMAAKGVVLLVPLLHNLEDQLRTSHSFISEESGISVSVNVLSSTLELLQDEDSEIREEATKFVTLFVSSEAKFEHLNPQACTKVLLEYAAKTIPQCQLVKHLWTKLETKIEVQVIFSEQESLKVQNPFEHDVGNVYAEEVKLVDLISEVLIRALSDADQTVCDDLRQEFAGKKEYVVRNIDTLLSHSDSSDKLEHSLSLVFTHPGLYLTSKKLHHQMAVFVFLGIGDRELLERLRRYIQLTSVPVLPEDQL